jgi:hypothetical protein
MVRWFQLQLEGEFGRLETERVMEESHVQGDWKQLKM